jgi:hypothetical protein
MGEMAWWWQHCAMRARLTTAAGIPRAAGMALAASALAHAALLGGDPARDDKAPLPRAINVSLRPPPAPLAALPEAAAPAAPALARPVRARAAKPAPLPAPLPAGMTADAPLLRLPGPAAWRYQLRQGGQDGEALLDWQPHDDGRYSLRLTRRIGERALPAMQSLGSTGSAGLVPERYALQRGGQDRQAINFDVEHRRLSFSASPAQRALPDGTQDRLSWWLQLAALVQAAPAPDGRWRLWVAGLRGELHEWTFEVVDAQPDDAGALHLRRQPLGPHDPGVELWLDPSRSYWPVRFRQGDPETRGFEMRLDSVNS